MAGFTVSLCFAAAIPVVPLRVSSRSCGFSDWSITVIDLIVIVLSTGGILLMAGYAVLCDKI